MLQSCARESRISPRHIHFEETAPGIIKVMTYNIRFDSGGEDPNRWGLRRDAVVDIIADHAVDVIGLQEALDSQIRDIKRAFPDYAIVAAGRDDGKKAGEACPVLYRRDRYRLADSGTFWFSNMPWKPGSMHWGNAYPRLCTWVRLQEANTEKGFYVFNLHLDHASQDSRYHSMKLLAKQITSRKHKEPVIVMGDFNMDTNNPAMMGIRMNGVWQHLHPDQPRITTFQAFGADTSGQCLDHILIDDFTEIIEVAIDATNFAGRYPSDHFPVIALLRMYNAQD
jgi:endonuclease/exonuclease/phosphatase family metal-dependent hydrolase